MATQVKSIAPSRKFTTPQLLKVGLYTAWSASLLVLLSAIAAIQTQRNSIEAVVETAIPNVIQAQRLKTAMSDIDSIIANQLLESSSAMSKTEQADYNQRRNDLAERLVVASQNMSLGEAETSAIEQVVLNFNDYIGQTERAQFAKERGDRTAMFTAYRQAALILNETLIPNADKFAQVNQDALEQRYQAAQNAARRSLWLIALSGLFLIASLIGLQIFLSQRTKRTFNPMLFVATAIATIFLAHTIALMSSANQLRVMKEEIYAPLINLRIGRVHLYLANGFKSRYLLDKALSYQHESAFIDQTQKLLTLPASTSIESVISAYQNGNQVPGISGYFADALNHIQFPGEREALMAMMQDYAQYLQIDRQIRQLNVSGDQQAAIALSVGRNSGQSYWAFDQLRDANEKAIDIKTEALNQVKTDTLRSLDGFEAKALTAMFSIALLILFGLRPRLREYFI